jgi:DNA-binding response OmpR family regulator
MIAAGYEVECISSGPETWETGSEQVRDVIILDLGLPGLDGLTVLKRWRKEGIETPVIVLTARGNWMERVDGFDAGADDYLPKPFRTEELIARIKALLRRATPRKSNSLSNGHLSFDEASMQATLGGKPLDLSPIEARTVQMFLKRPGALGSGAEAAGALQHQSCTVLRPWAGRRRCCCSPQ